MSSTVKNWYVYFLRCSDNSVYCGITNNLDRRLKDHNHSPRGSKYTRSRRPVFLVWFVEVSSRSEALKMEYRLKKLSKEKKEKIIELNSSFYDVINFDSRS